MNGFSLANFGEQQRVFRDKDFDGAINDSIHKSLPGKHKTTA